MPQSAARQGDSSSPPPFDQWWKEEEGKFDTRYGTAQAAWLAAIRYAEFNIGLELPEPDSEYFD